MLDMIKIVHVSKRFKDTVALQDINMAFKRGLIHGIVGHNGSGKTVLFKCICGLIEPDSGQIIVDGKEVAPMTQQNIGAIIENPGFISSLSGFRNLKLLASIHGHITDEQIRNTITCVGLDPLDKKKVKNYSLGMRHRLGIAQAIMENPPLLILDEPMNGLDKQGVEEIRALFLGLKKQGKTILISSHNEEDIKVLCDTVCEMNAGVLHSIE